MSASITKITVNGILTIEFNSTMLHDFDLTLLNSTVVDLYLVPALEDQVPVNFTWYVLAYQDTTLSI